MKHIDTSVSDYIANVYRQISEGAAEASRTERRRCEQAGAQHMLSTKPEFTVHLNSEGKIAKTSDEAVVTAKFTVSL